MSHLAPSRALWRNIQQELALPSSPCRRLLSSAASSSARRPIAVFLNYSPNPQPFIQKRFKYKSVEEAKSRHMTGVGINGSVRVKSFVTLRSRLTGVRIQPFSWKAGALFVVTAAGLAWYFHREKERMQKKRIAEANKAVGKPLVGGSFSLVDHNGKTFTDADLKGKYSLIYFGFTHCPDICPEELDKMALMYELVEKQIPGHLKGVFVTCDPARDGPEELKRYLVEFHPKFVGLTGSYDGIKAMCKAYRVYFSTPSNVPSGKDYLVDHSIYFYLMDPDGHFVEALGRQHSPQDGAKLILGHITQWKGPIEREQNSE